MKILYPIYNQKSIWYNIVNIMCVIRIDDAAQKTKKVTLVMLPKTK